MVYTIGTMILIEVQNGLRIAARLQLMSTRKQPGPEVAVIVDLPVEHDHLRAIFVENRLPTARQVNDAEAAHPETHAPPEEHPFVVRAAVPDGVAHLANRVPADRTVAVAMGDADDAAHDQVALRGRMAGSRRRR